VVQVSWVWCHSRAVTPYPAPLNITPQTPNPAIKNAGAHWIEGWVGPRAGLDDVEKQKASKIQSDQKSLYTWWLKYTSFLPHYLVQSDCLTADRQGQGDTRLTLTPSVIPNSNYVIMVSDWNCLKCVCAFLYCNHQVHRDILITLYKFIYWVWGQKILNFRFLQTRLWTDSSSFPAENHPFHVCVTILTPYEILILERYLESDSNPVLYQVLKVLAWNRKEDTCLILLFFFYIVDLSDIIAIIRNFAISSSFRCEFRLGLVRLG
jgi:hypothetical protein